MVNKNILEKLHKAISKVTAVTKVTTYEDLKGQACRCAIGCEGRPDKAECVHQCYLQNMNVNDGTEIGALYGECLFSTVCKCIKSCQDSYGGIGGSWPAVEDCAIGCMKRIMPYHDDFCKEKPKLCIGDLIKRCNK